MDENEEHVGAKVNEINTNEEFEQAQKVFVTRRQAMKKSSKSLLGLGAAAFLGLGMPGMPMTKKVQGALCCGLFSCRGGCRGCSGCTLGCEGTCYSVCAALNYS